MKFVCDKCKTRYSIGEERVRGKILKIRCKNCANVITVREGMDAEGGDRSRPTTAAPPAARAAASPPPPPALDQEWYVSIDGVQSGPFTLADAQKWVASKPIEADLHCWSEGFDDWLSVDKVAHFRNLRKAKPPVPTPPTRRPPSIPPPTPPREEAKPLFAATMAAIEKDASQSGALPKASTSGPMPAATKSKPTPAGGARANGSAQVPAIPAMPSRAPAPSGRYKSASHAALAAAFEPDDGADSRTQIEAPPFPEGTPAAEPLAAKRAPNGSSAFDIGSVSDPAAAVPPADSPKDPFESKPAKSVQEALESDDDDDDLSIGEVSRVVKLADLAPKPKPIAPAASASQTGSTRIGGATASTPRLGAGTASNPRFTASQPRISPTELGMNVNPALLAEGPAPDESIVARSFAQRHRRGMIALIAFAGVLVAGVVGFVVFKTSSQSDEIVIGGFGGTRTIDTSRPEDIVRRQLPPNPDDPNAGSASTGTSTTTTTKPKTNTSTSKPNTTTQTPIPEDPKGLSLRASEIEEMAAKQGEGTKRCYMRAQKGALGFEIAEVKKIAVTMTIGKDGVVSSVSLSAHQNDSFGECLIARIKSWKFRESPSGGTFRISLAFSNT